MKKERTQSARTDGQAVNVTDGQTESGQTVNATDGQTVNATDGQTAKATEGKAIGSKSGQAFKRFVKRYFIDAFSGMALGLFCSLIAGTIIWQIGSLIGNNAVGKIILNIGNACKFVMGGCIGVGIAHTLKAKKLTTFSAGAAGFLGANITNIFAMSGVKIWGTSGGAAFGIGDPVAAYFAAVFAIEIANLIEGKTPVDILVVPLTAIVTGAAASMAFGLPFSILFSLLGKAIALAMTLEPISSGIIVAVAMGLLLTLPTSSAAFGIMLFAGLDSVGAGLAAGAAVAGGAAHMVGFAVASFRENRWGGLVSQGLGTSMLQIPNLAGNLRILLPAVAASAVAGPVSSAAFGLICNAAGSGMGTAGMVGVICTFTESLAAGLSWWYILIGVFVCYFLIPAVVAFGVSELLRKVKWIKFGDMKLQR